MAVLVTVRDLLGREVYCNEAAITEASGEHTRTIVLNDSSKQGLAGLRFNPRIVTIRFPFVS
jgi:hypothetical protein